jgi:serine/threonine protein phosphatase PrpC
MIERRHERRCSPVTTNALRQVLSQLGYTVIDRVDTWSECYVANAYEHWRGRGTDADDAFEDALRQMLPSALGRHLLEAHIQAAGGPDGGRSLAPPGAGGASATAAPVSPLILRAAARTDPGRARDQSPEAVLCAPERGVVAVVDGVKATVAGATAAKIIVAELGKTFEAATSLSPIRMRGLPTLLAALQRANKEIFEAAKRDPKLRGMLAHVAVALVVDQHVVVAHLGSCRVYRLRGRALEVLGGDAKAAQGSKSKTVRAIGADRTVEVDTSVVAAQAGDVLLVCTDGLTGAVSQEALFDALRISEEPSAAVDALLSLAATKSAPEGATAAVLRLDVPSG